MANRFNEVFGTETALIQGPMGGVAGPRLVAAVAASGAMGVLPIWADSLDVARQQIEETQALGDGQPFAVNLRADLEQFDHIRLAADRGIEWFHLFWGDPATSAAEVRKLGAKFIATVGDTEAAQRALDAGASALVAQGVEAGGHVLSETPLTELLPAVVGCAGDVPVVAAGGIGNETDASMAVNAGATGVLCGSRFVASEEAMAHPLYKMAILNASAGDTVRSECFDLGWSNAPHRTLRNDTYDMWAQAGYPPMGKRPGETDVVLKLASGTEITRYFVLPPAEGMQGDIAAAALYAGTSVGNIDTIEPAAAIVERFADVLAGA